MAEPIAPEPVTHEPVTPEYVIPDWPAPDNVRAVFTTRIGGYSKQPCDSYNLGLHVGDDPQHVAYNRRLLADTLSLPASPFYLEQVHGINVVCVDEFSTTAHTPAHTPAHIPAPAPVVPPADASWGSNADSVIAIMTADCLPVLFASRCGDVIAGAHAGWRGLADGVLENTVACLPVAPAELIAWLGPAIGPEKFEVGAEVRECFLRHDAASYKHFKPIGLSPSSSNTPASSKTPAPSHSAEPRKEKYLADLYGLARERLTAAGVESVYGGDLCTHTQADRFFSHRRDQGKTGRMAALIWKV